MLHRLPQTELLSETADPPLIRGISGSGDVRWLADWSVALANEKRQVNYEVIAGDDQFRVLCPELPSDEICVSQLQIPLFRKADRECPDRRLRILRHKSDDGRAAGSSGRPASLRVSSTAA